MFYVKLFIRRGKKCWFCEKELDFGVNKNWKIVMKFYNDEGVYWGSIFDEVNLCCWEWEKGKRIVRVDRE